ncbi:TetR/AcrR family transcriptional regulator [Rhodococcus sp. 14C212]|uniref:TetR/AcrR family transcriptional regulator n=1 Tax=Rhodococcus sp. 14C212 TaxID=2711209 RepID=UPI0013ECF8C9|nr:TetR/AcrR family transcriptional regulator [Rhodococcus sp. 14C212]NGP08880.1 TetR/AcrR family transcriptional regulator [Rhodococcus sp. 14C212]
MSTPGSKPPRRRARRDNAARVHILDAAETLFAAHGFDATSTTAIAVAADVPKGLIFYYFPTKESILETLVAERLPAEPIQDVTGLVSPGDPAASLVNLDAALDLRTHHSSLLRVIWREAETHPGLRTPLRRLRTSLQEATMRVLQASVPGPIQPGTLRTCATTWVSAMFSAATVDRLFGLDGPSPDELGGIARLVAAGMTGMG